MLSSQRLLEDRYRPAKDVDPLHDSALVEQRRRDAHAHRRRVAGARHAVGHAGRVAEVLLRAIETASRERVDAQVAHRLGDLEVLHAVDFAAQAEDLSVQGFRAIGVAASGVDPGELIHRLGQIGTVAAGRTASQFECLHQDRCGYVVQIERSIDAADGVEKRRARLRLASELRVEPLTAQIEELARADLLSFRRSGSDASNRLTRKAAVAAAIAFLRDRDRARRNAARLNRHRDAKGGEEQQARRGDGDTARDAAGRTFAPIGDTRRPRTTGSSARCRLQIGSELGRRRIAPRPVLLHRLERDPVEIAPQLPRQRGGSVRRVARDVVPASRQRAQPRARPRRLVLADDPLDLVVAGAAQDARGSNGSAPASSS